MAGQSLVGFSVFNGLAPLTKDGADGSPIQGPRCIQYTANFTPQNQSLSLELFQENEQKQLDFVQTLYIDNSASGFSITVQSLVTNQKLVVPPYHQAYLPVLTIDQTQFVFSKAVTANENIPIHLINVPMPAAVWPARNLAVTGANAMATGQVVVGTVATLVVPARDRRNAVTIENLGTNIVALGSANTVTLANGFPLQGVAGASITIPTRGEIWAIAGAAQNVGYLETY